ncbi:MAG: PilZ domain-containing protein [bacterium]|nr:PilZ domain-containing protein [bacterium]
MKDSAEDRRRHARTPGTGRVEIVLESGLPLTIDGELIDFSASGFRAAHTHPSLEPGDHVFFEHNQARGEARVIWNRVTSGRVETGFLLD